VRRDDTRATLIDSEINAIALSARRYVFSTILICFLIAASVRCLIQSPIVVILFCLLAASKMAGNLLRIEGVKCVCFVVGCKKIKMLNHI